MKKPYTQSIGFIKQLRRLGLTALLASGTALGAQAQGLNYTATAALNTTSTFTDLGATGTVITTANTDDANSTAQPIGFSFNYNGTAFTQFVLNTNGLIRLGGSAPSAANMFIQNEIASTTNPVGIDPLGSTDPADVNLLMPFNFDLEAGTATPEYRVTTTGTSPNQVCTIQWKNVRDKAADNAPQFASFTFQVKLYETTNQIEFVYGAPTATTNTAIGRYATIAIKGSGIGVGQNVIVSKSSSQVAWSGATFTSGLTSTTYRVFYRRTFAPDAGRTFRFNTAPANDGAVNAIYTLGKLPIPVGLPHAVQALVSNAGSTTLTNLPVTLAVTGANTFTNTQTIASLAVGASTTVTFANYPTTLAAGINNLTVTIPADAVLSNNSATWQQAVVTTAAFSYVPPNQTTDDTAFGNTTAGLIFAAKYTLPTTVAISTVSAFIEDANSVGKTVSGAVLSTAGVILARSANYVVQSSDVGSYKTFTITTPPTVNAGTSILAGLVQAAYTGAQYFPMGVQTELPARPATFYTIAVAGGTPADFAAQGYRFMLDIGTVPPASCASVTGLTATNPTATGATITFTDPISAGSYQIVYGPTGFDPAAGGTVVTATASPFTLTTLQPGNNYDVYVRTNCTGGGTSYVVGPVSVVTPCVNTAAIAGFPYTESFDNIPTGQALPCGITIIDANNDAVTWRISTENPNSGTRNIRYQGIVANGAADDWFFTPALALPSTANTRFQVAFRYRAAGTGSTGTSAYTEALEVKSGAVATVAGQTNLLYTNNSINNLTYNLANGTSTPVVAYLPAGASTQYVGFHVKSPALQGNLYIDDLSVTAVTVTATSDALLRAVNVFPNPSETGVFNLAVNGANAKQGLEVEVVNNLGQRVYGGTARDNFTNTLDLSRLAAGLYHLKVKNGDEYMLRQISIVK